MATATDRCAAAMDTAIDALAAHGEQITALITTIAAMQTANDAHIAELKLDIAARLDALKED